MKLSPSQLRTLRRVARGEKLRDGGRYSKTMRDLETLGLVRCWPDSDPIVTPQGTAALAEAA